MSKSKIAWKDAKNPPKIIYHDTDEDGYEWNYSELCLVKSDEIYELARWYEDVWLEEEHGDTVNNVIKYVELDED